jgi:hypothetical protein
MTKYDTGVKGSSASANDTLANNVAYLRANMPTNNVVLASDRESFSILGNVTELPNSLSLGYDNITLLLYTAQPVLKFISLSVKVTQANSLKNVSYDTLLDFPITETAVLDFMNNQLQIIIQNARNEALDKGEDYYRFNLPNAARLDELAAIYGFDTIGKPKTFTNISLGYIS